MRRDFNYFPIHFQIFFFNFHILIPFQIEPKNIFTWAFLRVPIFNLIEIHKHNLVKLQGKLAHPCWSFRISLRLRPFWLRFCQKLEVFVTFCAIFVQYIRIECIFSCQTFFMIFRMIILQFHVNANRSSFVPFWWIKFKHLRLIVVWRPESNGFLTQKLLICDPPRISFVINHPRQAKLVTFSRFHCKS